MSGLKYLKDHFCSKQSLGRLTDPSPAERAVGVHLIWSHIQNRKESKYFIVTILFFTSFKK